MSRLQQAAKTIEKVSLRTAEEIVDGMQKRIDMLKAKNEVETNLVNQTRIVELELLIRWIKKFKD